MRGSRKRSRGSSRRLMFAASSVWVALILVVFVFRGGGAVPVARTPLPSPPSLAEQAGALAGLGDYEGAWRFYYEALLAAPEEVSLWYGLGVTLSHLGRSAETEEAFQHVVRRGPPGSEEVTRARRWLISAGVLAEREMFTGRPDVAETTGTHAVLKGKATWGETDPGPVLLKVQISLEGLDGAARGRRFTSRVPLHQPFRIERLPAGSYRLFGNVGDSLLWDLALSVRGDEEIALDLTRDNSLNPTAALPL